MSELSEMLANRVRKRSRHLSKWARRQGITCYRVYDRDIPEIPLAIDWYDGRVHVSEYARKGTEPIESDVMRGWVMALARTLEVLPEAIYVKRRERQRGSSQYTRQAEGGHRFQITEGSAKLWVNLSDYLDTGVFLDHRCAREMVRDEAEGKDMLNLFAYTGAFSVQAALGGARSTTSVDMSKTYCEWAIDNLSLNDFRGPSHEVLCADVLRWLERAPLATYDLVVCDPPTFSNSKKMVGHFDVQHDHAALLKSVARLLRADGVCYFSTNFRRFKPDEHAFASFSDHREITATTVPPDFRDRRVHRAWRLTK